MINLDQKIYGYRRDNNRVGIRNYVVILPVDDISNAACEAVSYTHLRAHETRHDLV